jgi:hypothetical protein
MKSSPLDGLVIRTAVVRTPEIGYIYACDLDKECNETPHTITYKWDSGRLIEGACNHDALTLCLVTKPHACLVDMAETGHYSIISSEGNSLGNILDDSFPPAVKPRYGGFRRLSEISGKAYAIGLRGMVYRMDELHQWTRIDNGLPDTFDIQAIDGFEASDLFAAGRNGDLWHYNGSHWTQVPIPTTTNLTAIKCAGDGNVYVAGHEGLLLRGCGSLWEVIDQNKTNDHIWDLEWFNGQLYLSTLYAIYILEEQNLKEVDLGDDPPKNCYQLSTAEGVLWSNGENGILAYDGKQWTRIV